MRPALLLAVIATSLPAAAQAAPASYPLFDRSIAATKQAMMGDPEHALASALSAVAIAKELPPSPRARVAAIEAEWLHAEALLYLNKLSEAAPITQAMLAQAERLAPNTKLHGDLLRSHGAIAAATGDNGQALRDYLHAHQVFRAAGVPRSQGLALQDIGSLYLDAGDFARALDYFGQAADAFPNDPKLALTLHNNRAEVFRKQQHYAQAVSAYRAALVEARKIGSPMLQVRILTNLAGAQAEWHRLAAAQVSAQQAMSLAGHGEASGWQPFVFGIAARIALEQGDPARAEQLIARTFQGVDLTKSEMLFREYHGTAARIYEQQGDVQRALAHLKAFQRLDSEAQALTASAASQLLAARFDFANQNLTISQLKQGQLKRDFAMERQKTQYRLILLSAVAAAGALVTALLLAGFFSIRRSRNAVRAANVDLSNANGALETALRAKTEFLATTSHEIRTPLNGILGMTQVLLADRRVTTDIRERIEVVHGAGETMRALVDDILDVAKMENGKLTVAHEPTDVAKILREVACLWGGQAETKGLSLLVDIDAAPARILSDGSRLRQIVFNLLSNALKFTQAGEVALHAHTNVGEDGAEQLVIAVRDTGIGIPADQLESVFEAFRQVDGGVTRQFGGTGLGLAICRNLARALGGDIAIESALAHGTTFTVRLPLERVADVAVTDEQVESGLADASLLIVERDPAVRSLLQMLLAAEVARISAVATIEDALVAVGDGDVTHVLVDAGAANRSDPLGDLKTLAAAARQADMHCTVLIAPSPELSLADALSIGASQVVAKPIGADDLIAAMTDLYLDQVEKPLSPAPGWRSAA